MSPVLHRIKAVSNRCEMLRKNVRRLINSSPVHRGASFSAISDPSEQEPIRIDDPGRVGNDGGESPERASGREI